MKMLAKGISPQTISDITGLTPEQIEKLVSERNRVSETAAAYSPARKSTKRTGKTKSP